MYLANGAASRGLLNEITGYILGQALNVPMAEHAFVCLIPLNKLKRLPSHHGWVSDLLRKNKNAEYPAFCTSKINGGDAVIEQSRVGPKLFAEDLRQWPALSLAARFDQHITNTDRHLHNLRREGKNRYRLFDHGRLVTTDGDWMHADLLALEQQKQPDKLLERAWPDGCPIEKINEMLLHLGYHETALTIVLPELRWWWSRLADEKDASGFERYLVARAKGLKAMYQTAYNQLPL
jgi:hypothetical protein